MAIFVTQFYSEPPKYQDLDLFMALSIGFIKVPDNVGIDLIHI